ncbi:MAG TPA: exopolyphosphatase [Burkholderiales bacterium]|nr:exopolyphosphatase [Burkholderiales bacterium]
MPVPGTVKQETLAAVDLGSNSFHLQIGRVVDDQIYMLDNLRDSVRLAAGLNRDRRIDQATQARALEALARFGERLRGFPRSAVRAVGTSALRTAKNARSFLSEAEARLGFPIEVIFGREEARLIYLGVAHSLAPSAERRLAIDIGGGSTEIIIGTGLDPELMESVPMGCVSYTLRFFPDGRLDKSSFKRAELAAANELQRIVDAFQHAGWTHAVASSGTAKSLASMARQSGLREQGISATALDKLRSQFIKAGEIDRLDIPGLRGERAAIIPGGLAIMSAALAEFGIEELDVSDGALRQGVLYDLLGRVRHRDMREATVKQFMRRYQVDAAQAERVARFAQGIHASLNAEPAEADSTMLHWAASLHEIGISIAHAGYHKHSAYILAQADMPGFSQSEQARLSRLVLAHRGKLKKLEDLPESSADRELIFALRLAALFCLSRRELALPAPACKSSKSGFQLALPRAWLEEHPMTESALEEETDEWRSVGVKLEVRAAAKEDRAALTG